MRRIYHDERSQRRKEGPVDWKKHKVAVVMERITRLQEEPGTLHHQRNKKNSIPWLFLLSAPVEMAESEKVVTFCEPGGSSVMPFLSVMGAVAWAEAFSHSQPILRERLTFVQVCCGGNPTSASASFTSTRCTILQLSCIGAHWFIYEPACGVKDVNSSRNDNTG